MNTDRVVVVTGAAGGIGSELVDRFLSNADTVIGCDLKQDALETWRERWPQNARLFTAETDVSSEESCGNLAAYARESMGHVDVLINCAGWFPSVSFEDMTSDHWRQVVDVNLTGTFLMTKAIVPLMKGRGWGRIVNFGSGSMYDGNPQQVHYVAAKAGVVGFTRSVARELGDDGITINVVTPGMTVTKAVTDTTPESFLAEQRARGALHRDEVAADLVGPVFFLASDDAAFITGQTLNVDGGRYML